MSKLEEVERELGNLLAEMKCLRDQQSKKEHEVTRWEKEISTHKESVLTLEKREKKELMAEIEDLYTTTIERKRAFQVRGADKSLFLCTKGRLCGCHTPVQSAPSVGAVTHSVARCRQRAGKNPRARGCREVEPDYPLAAEGEPPDASTG